MPTVTVSAQIVTFPPVCVCCGAPQPGAAIQVIATRHQAGDWMRAKDKQLALPFPACAGCAAHAHGQPRSQYCAPGAPVVYKGWHGTQHTFEFTGPAYAAAFLHANLAAGKKAWGDVQPAPYPGPMFAGGAWPAPLHAAPGATGPAPRPSTGLGSVAWIVIGAVVFCCVIGIVAMDRGARRPADGSGAAPTHAEALTPVPDAGAQARDASNAPRPHHPARHGRP